ncbi:MAG: o-succinylbenzoate--CoA ligase [Rhodothermaceae bacterium]|nr:o-succinylbenzoate--CoA ligase [Rhodothermaceae bacterium]MYE63556.1 o-succinylbenzoate--CoA ligase [Rhodothermaceae bacterium]MYJ19694.1 o-succinylbenzoate--CoA ligase [Rhodothermaceae bacterium]
MTTNSSSLHNLSRRIISGSLSGVGICLESNWQTVGIILEYIKKGVPVCMLSTQWPGAAVDQALDQLGITNVVTKRKDLKTSRIDPDSYDTNCVDYPEIHTGSDKIATILHTSGSSGGPKAVAHTLDNHIASAKSTCSELNLGSNDRWLLNLPLWHVSGMSIIFRCLMSGAKIIIPDPDMPLLEALFAHKITHVSMVAAQLMQVIDQPPPASLRAAIVGGGPTPHHILDQGIKRGWPIRTTYGMTETSSMVTLSDKKFPDGSSGHTLQGNEIKIAQDGEILIRSPAVCLGYLNGGSVQSAVDNDGWLHTGDLGKLDPTGQLYVLGRKDNMFISGGENISPEEIEQVLHSFPEVQESVVVPVPNSRFGQRPVAFIRGCSDFEGLTHFLAQHLPKFKIPVFYSWPTEIPSTSLKHNRKSLINLAIRLQNT